MTVTEILNGWYCDALPTGEFAALVPVNGIVKTHLGDIPCPPDDRPLYIRITNVPEFKITGQAHFNNDVTYEWTQSTQVWNILDRACGVSPVIYDNNGLLKISDCSQGSQGYRYVDKNNRIWTGDETYNSGHADYGPPAGLWEWSEYAGIYIGQGDPDKILVYADGALRKLADEFCTFVRVHGVGDNVTISCVKPNRAAIIQATVTELRMLPPINQDNSDYQQQIDALEQRVSHLEVKSVEQNNKINVLSNDLNSLNHEVEQIKEAITHLPSTGDGIKSGSIISLKSNRDRYLRDDWQDDLAHFDREIAGPGEKFTVVSDDPDPPDPIEPTDPIEWPLETRENSKFFYRNGEIVRIKRFTSFKLARLYETGNDIRPILEEFHGYNSVRVFANTSGTWAPNDWPYPDKIIFREFCEVLSEYGFDCELVLLTDGVADRVDDAKELITYLSKNPPNNLMLEAVNEPHVGNKSNPYDLENVLRNSPFIYTSGIYDDNRNFYGMYWNDHSARDEEWWRKGGHNLLEAWQGGGPNNPEEPALKCPGLEDEPIRPDQTGYNALDFYQYAASCGLMGAGACFHFASGRLSQPMTPDERRCSLSFLEGLTVFPSNAANGNYRRIVEPGQSGGARTYIMGNNAIRIHQNGFEFPEQGWAALDDYGICWRKLSV